MLPRIHIPVQPSSQDCLAWSPDGELAVAAGEEVYLLIPQDDSPEPWTHLRITVSNFTFEEWPWQEQASFKDMSIGEEQATATVTALAWSPPGLAKHRRSVLAVLTSNLILSFWSSNANPMMVDSWERILIVNKALYPGSRLQQRIRSMAWVPMNPQQVDRQTPFSRRKWGIPLIAIADDCNGVYMLKVSSPFAGQSFEWTVEVLHRHNIPVSNPPNYRPSLLSLAMNANHFVDHIEFGTWKGGIPVLYRTSGIIHHAIISVHEDLRSRVRSEDHPDCGSLIVDLDEVNAGDANMLPQITVTPFIKAQMAAEKEKFGLDNSIGNHVRLRRWGLASFQDLSAACITLHPAKMIEYIAPFDGNSIIIFDAGSKNSDTTSLLPWNGPSQTDVAKAQRTIMDTILDLKLHKSLTLNDLDLKVLYTAFCGNLLLSGDKLLQRLQAAMDILNLIEHHASVDLVPENQALLLIRNSFQLTDQELIDTVRQMTKARGQAESSLGTIEKALLDLCPFCPGTGIVVIFDNFTEGRCPQGHSFGALFPLRPDLSLSYNHAARCALTFLPMLEPGSSKRCTNCKREFIDERSHPGVQMQSPKRLGLCNVGDGNTAAAQESSGIVKHSLASILFDKFDTCPYCGGKFCS